MFAFRHQYFFLKRHDDNFVRVYEQKYSKKNSNLRKHDSKKIFFDARQSFQRCDLDSQCLRDHCFHFLHCFNLFRRFRRLRRFH
jgi:hypothetical protein